ncbi:PEP-CTERM motif protein [Janthinobacterium sp. HH107]|uniref:FxDxF family PEP-CTERM protein n=1 Tax=Janthinobacterium sp. HH107 TaxID=1537279 RepID=UPI00087434A6|nr:FxDxF family PEP-CTERM protein [Janthinobacterium sp. HH107]OEZ92182.1 PEP-CTERM motif protein [Janthinobacterium sp. HH107]
MNRKFYWATLALCLASAAVRADNFKNGGFENGNATGWTTGEGYRGNTLNDSLNPGKLLPGGGLYSGPATRSDIIDAGTIDPNIGSQLGSTVYAGKYSYRVEDTYVGGYASVISQSVSNYSESDIFFTWKAVIENGGHADNESAAFFISLRDDTTGTELVKRFYNAGNGGGGVDARFKTYGDYYYTPLWQIERLTIDSSLSGHDFTLSVAAADCYFNGHTGYAYVDGFGGVNPIPEPETYAMMLAGLGLLGFTARRRNKRA